MERAFEDKLAASRVRPVYVWIYGLQDFFQIRRLGLALGPARTGLSGQRSRPHSSTLQQWMEMLMLMLVRALILVRILVLTLVRTLVLHMCRPRAGDSVVVLAARRYGAPICAHPRAHGLRMGW